MMFFGLDLENLEFNKVGMWPLPVRIFLIVILSLSCLTFGIFFYGMPLVEEYSIQKNERLKLQATFQKQYEQALHLSEYKEQLRIVKEILQSWMLQLPPKSTQAELLEDLSQLASLCGLSFRSIKPLALEANDFYTTLPLELTLTGNYPNLGKFISAVTAMDRIITFHDFTVKLDVKNPRALLISLKMNTYWGESVEGSQENLDE